MSSAGIQQFRPPGARVVDGDRTHPPSGTRYLEESTCVEPGSEDAVRSQASMARALLSWFNSERVKTV